MNNPAAKKKNYNYSFFGDMFKKPFIAQLEKIPYWHDKFLSVN